MLKYLLIGALVTFPLHSLDRPSEVIDMIGEKPYTADQGSPAYPYYYPDGSIQHPYSYSIPPSGEAADYEEYPGIAYENSISTLKVVTAVVVGAALVAVVAIVIVNTPGKCGHCH